MKVAVNVPKKLMDLIELHNSKCDDKIVIKDAMRCGLIQAYNKKNKGFEIPFRQCDKL